MALRETAGQAEAAAEDGAGPLSDFARRIDRILADGGMPGPQRGDLVADVVRDLCQVFGEGGGAGVSRTPPSPISGETTEPESVKLSTGFGKDRKRGRAAPSDCETQP